MRIFENPADGMLLAGVALLTLIWLRKWYRRYGKRARLRRERLALKKPALKKATSQPLLDAPHDVVRWQVEMHELARDLKAELDTKIAALQAAVVSARRESERLESLLQTVRNLAATDGQDEQTVAQLGATDRQVEQNLEKQEATDNVMLGLEAPASDGVIGPDAPATDAAAELTNIRLRP